MNLSLSLPWLDPAVWRPSRRTTQYNKRTTRSTNFTRICTPHERFANVHLRPDAAISRGFVIRARDSSLGSSDRLVNGWTAICHRLVTRFWRDGLFILFAREKERDPENQRRRWCGERNRLANGSSVTAWQRIPSEGYTLPGPPCATVPTCLHTCLSPAFLPSAPLSPAAIPYGHLKRFTWRTPEFARALSESAERDLRSNFTADRTARDIMREETPFVLASYSNTLILSRLII